MSPTSTRSKRRSSGSDTTRSQYFAALPDDAEHRAASRELLSLEGFIGEQKLPASKWAALAKVAVRWSAADRRRLRDPEAFMALVAELEA